MNKNYYDAYRFCYNNSPHLNLNKPVDVSIEISSFCNMRCAYCYHAEGQKPFFTKNVMLPATFKQIVTSAAELEVPAIKMNWRGEPTINPFFYSMTSFVKERATNKTFIDRITNSNFFFKTSREEIFNGLKNQTKVKVSYDSFIPDVFETQRPGGNHEIITRNIDKFYNLRGRDNIFVIQAVRTKLNLNEDIEGEAKKRWPSALVSIRDMVGGRTDNETKDLEAVKRAGERRTCRQAHARLVFDLFGTATVCCPDIRMKLALGNIEDMSVRELFNCEKAKKIREDLLNKKAFDVEPCLGCSSFESFSNTDQDTRDS